MISTARHRLVWTTVGALACLMMLAGCGASAGTSATVPKDPSDPYAAEYTAAIDASSSDFVRQVLADHKITDQEFAESEDRYAACLKDAGIEPYRQDTEAGTKTYSTVALPAGDEASEAATTCSAQWLGEIESIYSAGLQNPTNEDWWVLVARCLVDQGVVPEGTTGKDVNDTMTQLGTRFGSAEGSDEPVKIAGPQNPDATFPGGVRPDSAEAAPCMANPLAPESFVP